MRHELALFLVAALLTFGGVLFAVLFLLGLLRHFSWSRRTRRRIGWYT
jgi:hypothetical protein